MCIVHHFRVMNVESLSISLMGPPRLWMMQPAPAKGCNTTNNETPKSRSITAFVHHISSFSIQISINYVEQANVDGVA